MRRIAVFGNAGGDKSTLARQLAEITGLPLHVLDILGYPGGRYRPDEKDGGRLPEEEYRRLHAEILRRECWIIDGYGGLDSAWERFAAADTLVHVDLPLLAHYWGVTKRLGAGLFRNPPGWPEGSPVWASSMSSYRVVRRCHRQLTPRYRAMVDEAAATKSVHRLTSRRAVADFLAQASARSPARRT